MKAALGVALAVGAAALDPARQTSLDDFFSRPAIEILSPPHDHLQLETAMSVEVKLRPQSLRSALENHHVCIGLTTEFVPEDIHLEPPKSSQEICYESRANRSVYAIERLLPGVSYAVSAALVNRGRVVAISMRSFKVASLIATDGETGTSMRMSIADVIRLGKQFHMDDNRAAAIKLYSQVLAIFPEYAPALHHLGQAHYQDGETAKAAELIAEAIRVDGTDASMFVSQALCLKAMGRTDDAVQAYRRALELRPTYVHAALGLGGLLQSLGKWDEAIHEYRKVVSTQHEPQSEPQILEPPHERLVVEANAWLCELLRLTQGLQEAERCLAQAIRHFPDEVRFHIDRGHLLQLGRQFEPALREYEAASRLGSVHAMTHAADVMESLGDFDGCLARYDEVMASPHTRGTTVQNQIAIMITTVLPRVLPSPDTIDMIRNRFEDNMHRVIQATNEGMNPILIDPGRIPFSTGITLNSHNRNNRKLKALLGDMYFGLFVSPGVVHEEYVDSYGITPIPYHQLYSHNPPFLHRRLRVGFVSRFLFSAAAGLFVNELLPQIDASKFEVYAFGVGLSKSIKAYEQVAQVAEHVIALPRDLRLAREEIRAHEVDVLVYPEVGMDKTTYFLSYHRLARVQAAWWGNPETTGVPTIDVFITSEYEHNEFREHYAERVYQMRGMGIFHSMPPLPNSTITREDIRQTIQERFNVPGDFHFYLSIESILHFHPDFDEAVRLILLRDPLAHLFLLSTSNRKNWKQLLQRRIEAHIGPEFSGRVLFFTDVDPRQEILLLGAADSVLASLYLTRPRAAIQAFTAGVPVVTFAGKLWATRITAGLYKEMGVKGLTATSIEAYVNLAVRLATDGAFRERMVNKIRRNRDRLSRNPSAVREWEKFFDHYARIARMGDSNSYDYTGLGSGSSEHLVGDAIHPQQTVEAMTCPLTSPLRPW